MKEIISIVAVVVLLLSCSNSGQTAANGGSNKTDSLELIKLLQGVYKWHEGHQKDLEDFEVVTKDSLQIGLDYEKFKRTFDGIKKTDYFSTAFLNNYKKIADYVNDKLVNAKPKYLNEINFAFQEADPWTNFQDDVPEFWNKLKISEFKSSSDKASLRWQTEAGDSYSEKYSVKFEKEGGKWKVSYLEGFDRSKYYR
jgi:hypothetical protein